MAALKWIRCLAPGRGKSALTRYLREARVDVVHVNCLPHLVGAQAAKAAGAPVVWHLREILPAGRRRRWFAAALREHAAAIVAVSEAVARWVRAEGLGDRLEVVPNGVAAASSPPDRAAALAGLGLDGDGVWIGLIGQLVEHKGALPFIEAAGRAAQRDPRLRFLIAGDGPDSFRRRCAQAARSAGLADRIRLLPPQPSGEALVAACDVVCLATTTPDPFPRAVLEAMAAGRAVVAFDSGGTSEMVQDGATGLVVPVGDVQGLAAAFVRLARDPEERRAFGEAAVRRARERFSIEGHVRRMESILVETARGAGARSR